jgi:proline dehydrogenase
MRSLLLWCAQNRWLATHVPRWRFARRAVKRFLPGEQFDDALRAAIAFKAQRIGALFTRLGENVTDLSEARATVEHYESVFSSASAAGVDFEVSVKPTQVGLDIDADAAYANLERLANAAAKAKSFLWLDMEGSSYTQVTLDLYRRLRAEHPRIGVCLQAYLYRTVEDAVGLMALKPAIRLVKGAYAEPPDRAFTAKKDVDASYLALCGLLLTEVKRGQLRLVLGSHDVELIARVTRFAHALGLEHALRDPNRSAGPPGRRRLRREGPHLVRRRLVPVVLAPAG